MAEIVCNRHDWRSKDFHGLYPQWSGLYQFNGLFSWDRPVVIAKAFGFITAASSVALRKHQQHAQILYFLGQHQEH